MELLNKFLAGCSVLTYPGVFIKKHQMKKSMYYALAGVLCLMAATANGQEVSSESGGNKKFKWEGGFNLYSLTIRPGSFATAEQPVYDYQAFSGMYGKLHCNSNTFRTELGFSRRDLHQTLNPTSQLTNGVTSFEFKLGYQRNFTHGRLRVYAFADLEYYHFWPTPEYYIYGPYYLYNESILPYYPVERYKLRGDMLAVAPGVGLSWRIGKHLVLGYEASAQFFYNKVRSTNVMYRDPMRSVGINAKAARFTIGFIF